MAKTPINTRRKSERKRGPVQQRILLLLLGGLGLACSGNPQTSWKIIGDMAREWKMISRQSAERAIQSLYESKLLEARENPDKTTTLILSEKGKKKAIAYKIRDIKIHHSPEWSGKWWFILFDIPEGEREARKSLRDHLENMGFFCFPKSVWVYPFNCTTEIEFIIELLGIRKYVRIIVAETVDNEYHLKKFFAIS